MSKTPIQELADYGQSIWLDFISRPLLEKGQLKKYIEQGLRGMTSNPSIFNQSIGSTSDYDEKIAALKSQGKTINEIYDELTVGDVRDAADQFKGVYEQTKGLDGYVSLEINPLLADKVEEQIAEGKRLYKKVGRPNVMIKVPSTNEGFLVIEELLSEGINVNVTLIFSLEQYVKTAQAYILGLNRLAQKGGDLSRVRSVASVFISRVDTTIDAKLDGKNADHLKGKAAVANARMIYEKFKELFSSSNFKSLQSKGAHAQRVLWASTSTKNPAYNDVKYVAELITKDTVNTLPENTLINFLDHGKVKEAFSYDAKEAVKIIESLKSADIDVNDVCAVLLTEGVQSFNKAFESLLKSLEKKAEQVSVA